MDTQTWPRKQPVHAQWLETLTVPAPSPHCLKTSGLPSHPSLAGLAGRIGPDLMLCQHGALSSLQEVAVTITQAGTLTWDLMARPCGRGEKD